MLFTTITVCYNPGEALGRTLDSIAAQNRADLEIWVIDGGSTDGTVEELRRREQQLAGQLHWLSEPDGGIYEAMNKGIVRAAGDYVNFLNCGDTYEPQALAAVAMAVAAHPEAQVLYGISRYVNGDGVEVRLIREHHTCFRERNICHQSLWYRRDVFAAFGNYDLTYRLLADYDFNIRLWQGGAAFLPLDAIVVTYRLDGVSSDVRHMEEGQKETMTIFHSHGMVDTAQYRWFMGSFRRHRLLERLRGWARKTYFFFAQRGRRQ